ncbi:chromosome-partitioning protein ParB [Litorimonas cladophorae]|uniref:Chromosome-partitioning protein ParB n=1 Tax=Litorimonas cladophorae TaxID=1220491 RepID=A0A918KN19_9PROT|nr:ParB/RepB/Spo0J family partition protein [Litorimonas cladophorae]GGX67326.1 chromosome-partitioning protein ParB [Litorimonas cladophorae]
MSDDKTPSKKSTAKKASARGLGRGLSALMADVSVPVEAPDTASAEESKASSSTANKITDTPDTSSRNVQFIAISRLDRNPDQPRKMFNEKDLAELTESIRRKGVLQPILVRPIPESARSKSESASVDFQIVAGERRWQASLKAGLDAMPVLIRHLNDQEVLEIGVVENVQRADLNPIEEARAYRALMDDFGRTQVEVSEAIGKARSHIANLLRLLEMPNQVMRWVELGRITPGHAKAIMTMPDPTETADMVIREGLSVRATEQYVKRYKEGAPLVSNLSVPRETDPNITALERDLSDLLGLKVSLNHKGPSGELKIKYKSGAQLEEVMRRLKN